MKTIVLAAGTGSRLGQLTSVRTKGMVPVKGRRLIDYLLDFIDADAMDEIIVVGGFCYEDLRDHLATRGQKNLRVIENKEFLKGNIFTLVAALDEFDKDSFLITNVDHIYPRVIFDKMSQSFSGITAMTDRDRQLGADDMKVKMNENGRINKISKQLDDFDCGYIGMTYVDETMNDVYRDAVSRTISSVGEKAVVENVLHLLASEEKYAPSVCDLSGFGWYEIDTPEELAAAESRIVNDPHFSALFD